MVIAILNPFSASALCFYGEDLILGMNYGVFYNDAEARNTWTAFSDNLPNVRIYDPPSADIACDMPPIKLINILNEEQRRIAKREAARKSR